MLHVDNLGHGLPKHDNLAEYEIAQTSGLAELRQQVSIFGRTTLWLVTLRSQSPQTWPEKK
jgi:hypothetical protein